MFGNSTKMSITNFSSCFVMHQEWLCMSECLDSQYTPCLISSWWRFCSVPEACGIFLLIEFLLLEIHFQFVRLTHGRAFLSDAQMFCLFRVKYRHWDSCVELRSAAYEEHYTNSCRKVLQSCLTFFLFFFSPFSKPAALNCLLCHCMTIPVILVAGLHTLWYYRLFIQHLKSKLAVALLYRTTMDLFT